jgi:hypothetical protein
MDALANMAGRVHPMNSNALNAIPMMPGRTPSRGNGNYVNTNPYNAQLGNGYSNSNVNANMAANVVNAANARRPRAVRREPNTRRPGN